MCIIRAGGLRMGIQVGMQTGKEALRDKCRGITTLAHGYWRIPKFLFTC